MYPDSSKVAEVIPIFKKGDHDKTSNYCSISLLQVSQFHKIFEKLLYSRIYFYLVRLSDCQLSFRKNCSTIFAINKINNHLFNNIDQSVYSRCIFLDLSKAFNTVNRSILLQKLEKMYGFRGNASSLMEGYLTNRYQCTKIGDSKLRQQQINCGVPQESSLISSLLFLLRVNNLPLVSQFSTTLFAVDALLALSDANLSRLENRVNTPDVTLITGSGAATGGRPPPQ